MLSRSYLRVIHPGRTLNSLPSRRWMATSFEAPKAPPSSVGAVQWGIGTALGVVGVVAVMAFGGSSSEHEHPHDGNAHGHDHKVKASKSGARVVDYAAVAKDIAEVLETDPDYDGIGHYGPVLVRLAYYPRHDSYYHLSPPMDRWHAAGTYDATTKTGGSNGGRMRFHPESGWGANAGLNIARNLLEPIKAKYGDQLSYGDLWTLAGVVAVKEMGGPSVPWRAGRVDEPDGSKSPADGRLPAADKKSDHIRAVFYRMGFQDQEIVALMGAHSLGKCHVDRSGYVGPWTFSPTTFGNAYFTLLQSEKWVPKTKHMDAVTGKAEAWKGPQQFTDEATQSLMMLPTDMEMVWDPEFKKWVQVYAESQDAFFQDFSKAFAKLLELGAEEQLAKSPVLLV